MAPAINKFILCGETRLRQERISRQVMKLKGIKVLGQKGQRH